MGFGVGKMSKDKTFMRVDKKLLDEIKKCKVVERESYADVVKRLVDEENKKQNRENRFYNIDDDFLKRKIRRLRK